MSCTHCHDSMQGGYLKFCSKDAAKLTSRGGIVVPETRTTDQGNAGRALAGRAGRLIHWLKVEWLLEAGCDAYLTCAWQKVHLKVPDISRYISLMNIRAAGNNFSCMSMWGHANAPVRCINKVALIPRSSGLGA